MRFSQGVQQSLLHQPSKWCYLFCWCTYCSVSALLPGGAAVSAAPTKQMMLSILWVHLLLGWCTSCSGKRQSRAETSAPPEIATTYNCAYLTTRLVRRSSAKRSCATRCRSAAVSASIRSQSAVTSFFHP